MAADNHDKADSEVTAQLYMLRICIKILQLRLLQADIVLPNVGDRALAGSISESRKVWQPSK